MYAIPFMALVFNPLDSTEYYIGVGPSAPTPDINGVTAWNPSRVGTIVGVEVDITQTGTAASAQRVRLDLQSQNFGNTLIGSGFMAGSNPGTALFSRTGTSIALVADGSDSIVIVLNTPAWAINPLGVTIAGRVYVNDELEENRLTTIESRITTAETNITTAEELTTAERDALAARGLFSRDNVGDTRSLD